VAASIVVLVDILGSCRFYPGGRFTGLVLTLVASRMYVKLSSYIL